MQTLVCCTHLERWITKRGGRIRRWKRGGGAGGKEKEDKEKEQRGKSRW